MSDQPTPDDIMANFDFGDIEGPGAGLEGFSDKVREDVEGLMYLGYLETDFEFCGHHFVIHTIHGDEELLAGLLTKEFMQTMAGEKAYVWATVAMCLQVIDGDSEWCPRITKSARDYARQRFQYVTGKWFWPVAVHIYDKYMELQDEQKVAFEAMEDLSQENRIMSMPSAEFSNDRADSEEQPPEDIRDFLDGEDPTNSKADSSSS